MFVLEFLKMYKPYLEQYKKLKIHDSDIEYINMVDEYNRMLNEGRKRANVRALMCRRYNITDSKFNSIESRLNRAFNIDDLL